jgi:hypothetical protein
MSRMAREIETVLVLHGPRRHVTVMWAGNLADPPVAEAARACQHLAPADLQPR